MSLYPIREMQKRYRRLHEDSLIPYELLVDFEDARKRLLCYLNSDTPINFVQKDSTTRAVTRLEVFDVFVWGGLVHANKHKKKKFDKWREELIFSALENEFVKILVHYLRAIRYMQRLNNEVLANIKPRQ